MREDDMTKEFFESAFRDRIPGGRLEEIDLKQVEYCGDGYMSQTYRLTAIFSKKGEPRKEYKLFVKSPFYNPKGDAAMRAGLTVECGAFIKEGAIYKQLLPAMTDLLKSKGVTEELPWADCWAVTDDGTMILEDLCSRGYKMRDQAIGLDMEHTTAAIKSIAKYHALSRVLRDQGVDSDIYARSYFDKDNLSVRQLFTYLFRTVADEVAKEDDEKWISKDMNSLLREATHWWHSLMVSTERMDTLHEEITRPTSFKRDIGEQLQAIGEDLMGHFDDELECGENDFDVLNHCDFRTSNMMFKYEEDGSLADLK
ncbi:hypothetical protein AAG570_005685 [Ranatra chinensis]|uniref:CHK kinase-like domain-containing protein n=1 Tax=Ranatra chinensis TaxID=642074 RepID=A0ABD0XZU1_9HEMI